MSKKIKKWKSYEMDMWNDSWTVTENAASNAIVDFYNKNLAKPTWIDLYDSLRGPLESNLTDTFYAIGRASLPKKNT